MKRIDYKFIENQLDNCVCASKTPSPEIDEKSNDEDKTGKEISTVLLSCLYKFFEILSALVRRTIVGILEDSVQDNIILSRSFSPLLESTVIKRPAKDVLE